MEQDWQAALYEEREIYRQLANDAKRRRWFGPDMKQAFQLRADNAPFSSGGVCGVSGELAVVLGSSSRAAA